MLKNLVGSHFTVVLASSAKIALHGRIDLRVQICFLAARSCNAINGFTVRDGP